VEYPNRKILGIIVPTIEILKFDVLTNVVLIGTTRTVNSGKYQLELNHKGNGNTILTQIAIPELVPLIERNELADAATIAIQTIETKAGESTVVVLGCTHYTQIKHQLRAHFKEDKKIISQDEIIPNKLNEYLTRHQEISSQLIHRGERHIHLTKHRPDYDRIMVQLLGGAHTR